MESRPLRLGGGGLAQRGDVIRAAPALRARRWRPSAVHLGSRRRTPLTQRAWRNRGAGVGHKIPPLMLAVVVVLFHVRLGAGGGGDDAGMVAAATATAARARAACMILA